MIDRNKKALNDIIYCIDLINRYTDGISKHAFLTSQEKQDLVVHRLEILGEATKRLTKDFISKYPGINWSEMAKMRDVLIHQYDGIDLEIVWETIKVDLVEVEKYVKDIYSKI